MSQMCLKCGECVSFFDLHTKRSKNSLETMNGGAATKTDSNSPSSGAMLTEQKHLTYIL